MGLAYRAVVYLVLLGYTVVVAGILMQHPTRTLSGDPPVGPLVEATVGMLLVLLGINLLLRLVRRSP